MTHYTLRFFSAAPSKEPQAPEAIEYGYDGIMFLGTFDPSPAVLQELAKAMDCICGPCLVTVKQDRSAEGLRPLYSAFSFIRQCAV
jgi:hypothetical protein